MDGRRRDVVPAANNSPYFHAGMRNSKTPAKEVTVTVVDPTPFVRDPEIRKTVLTATRSWQLRPDDSRSGLGPLPGITASTQTERPIGGTDVVYIAPTYHRVGPQPDGVASRRERRTRRGRPRDISARGAETLAGHAHTHCGSPQHRARQGDCRDPHVDHRQHRPDRRGGSVDARRRDPRRRCRPSLLHARRVHDEARRHRRPARLRRRRIPRERRRLASLLRLAGCAARHAVQVHAARHEHQGAHLRQSQLRRACRRSPGSRANPAGAHTASSTAASTPPATSARRKRFA